MSYKFWDKYLADKGLWVMNTAFTNADLKISRVRLGQNLLWLDTQGLNPPSWVVRTSQHGTLPWIRPPRGCDSDAMLKE